MEEDNDVNRGEQSLTYMSWYGHLEDGFISCWKRFLIYFIGSFGVFWGVIEAISFFYQQSLGLNNIAILIAILFVCFIGSLVRSVYDYMNIIPAGLENESKNTHKIVRSKRHYWEYALAYELMKSRIEKIDEDIDNIQNNRVHIKVTHSMGMEDYIQWLNTRPENLLRIVATAEQLMIFDLVKAMSYQDGEELDLSKLVKVVGLIKSSYENALDFEIEGRKIIIPEGFELIHSIQFEWISVIRDSFYQMLTVLKSVSDRAKEDRSPVEATIVFEEPPRVDEFCEELERLQSIAR